MKEYGIKQIYALPYKTRMLTAVLLFFIVFYLGYQWDLTDLKLKFIDNKQQENNLKQQYELVMLQQKSIKATISTFPATLSLLMN